MDMMQKAQSDFFNGKFVMIYDGDNREGEVDLVLHPKFASPDKIRLMRKEGGGLICLAVGKEYAEKLGLKFMTDILRASGDATTAGLCIEKTPYGDSPAFSISVNHRKTFTGISDEDRSLTIRAFEELVEKGAKPETLVKNFYAPGHVHLLIDRGYANRKGHTELGVEFAKRAGMPPLAVLCEMLGEGKSMKLEDARGFAKSNWIQMITNEDFEEVLDSGVCEDCF
ncbi:MAG: 3,4-dihydroxy-2-butanone-4-phosphate synthase [Candidatus Bilamarchaeaceae archaeon]